MDGVYRRGLKPAMILSKAGQLIWKTFYSKKSGQSIRQGKLWGKPPTLHPMVFATMRKNVMTDGLWLAVLVSETCPYTSKIVE
jgi:hypothetical protein